MAEIQSPPQARAGRCRVGNIDDSLIIIMQDICSVLLSLLSILLAFNFIAAWSLAPGVNSDSVVSVWDFVMEMLAKILDET